MRILSTSALALLVLAGCGQKALEECRTRANAEVETVDRLIEETEANLLRGYALEPDASNKGGFKLCAGGDGPLSLCAEKEKEAGTKPVAINPITERLKLANLRQRRRGLQELADRETAKCEAEFGR